MANCDVRSNVSTKSVIKEVIAGFIFVQYHTEVRWVKDYRPDVNETLIHVIVKTINAATKPSNNFTLAKLMSN